MIDNATDLLRELIAIHSPPYDQETFYPRHTDLLRRAKQLVAGETNDLPAYISGMLWQIARALVSLWVWSSIVERGGAISRETTFWIYNRDLAQGAVTSLNQCRFKVTIEMEEPATSK